MLDKVKELIAEELNVDINNLNLKTKLREDLGVDSLDVVELVMRLEEEFNINVSDEDANDLETVGAIVKYIEDRSE